MTLTVEDAKRRATVRLADGRLAILLAVHPRARTLKVWHAGRHLRLPETGVRLSEVDLHPLLSPALRKRLGVGIGPEDGPVPTSVDVS